MTSPIYLALPDGSVVCTDMISCALNAGHWKIGSYLMDKYHSSSCLTFKKQLEIEEKYKFGEHQKDARRALHQHAPHFQIALEYYADELKTKRFEICLYTHPHPLVDCPVVDSQLMID